MKTVKNYWKHWTALQIKVFQGTWHNTVKDDIVLQFSWYYEIRKQHSNVIRLLVFTRLNGIQTFDIWQTCLIAMLTYANG